MSEMMSEGKVDKDRRKLVGHCRAQCIPTVERLASQAKTAIQLEAKVEELEAELCLVGEQNTALVTAVNALHHQAKKQGVEICPDEVQPIIDQTKAENQKLVEEKELVRQILSDIVVCHDLNEWFDVTEDTTFGEHIDRARKLLCPE